jgi:hypothetical protein
MTAPSCAAPASGRPARALTSLLLIAAAIAPASAALNCSDRFTLANVPTVFDGFMFDVVVMHSKAVTMETSTFGRWRPEEEKTNGAALTLYHQKLFHTRADFCPLVPPDLPVNADAWKLYQTETAAAIGAGTVVSDQVDSTGEAGGVCILGWDTREARFTRREANGEVRSVEHHWILTRGNSGLRIVLTAPPPAFEDALEDLRFLLSRLTLPGAHDN